MTALDSRTAGAGRCPDPATPQVIADGRDWKPVGALHEAGVVIEEERALTEALSQVASDCEIPEVLYRVATQVVVFLLGVAGQMPIERSAADRREETVTAVL